MSNVILSDLVRNLQYKSGWTFHLMESGGLEVPYIPRALGRNNLIISVRCLDSEGRGEVVVSHQSQVPLVGHNDERWWRRWLLQQILNIETHEACEFFQVGGDKPFFPDHTPGADPYAVRERDAA